MTDTAPSPAADPAAVRKFLANHSVRILAGWAPNGVKHGCGASKLVEIFILHTFTSHWLWRENAEPEWHVVGSDHWAAEEAMAAEGWAQVEVDSRSEAGMALLALLPAEALRD